jgi:hypothetical protein
VKNEKRKLTDSRRKEQKLVCKNEGIINEGSSREKLHRNGGRLQIFFTYGSN